MADIINLRRARKAGLRASAAAEAAANRAKFGQTKAEKMRDMETRARIDRTIDGARRGD